VKTWVTSFEDRRTEKPDTKFLLEFFFFLVPNGSSGGDEHGDHYSSDDAL
jgi:hypothetical protein